MSSMHLKFLTSLFICLSLSLGAYSQIDTISSTQMELDYPTIGLGMGSISFMGDIKDNDYGHPLTSNFAYQLYVSQAINEFLSINFSAMVAKVRVEERDIQRNLNFQTDLLSGGINLQYNFANFLPADRKISPYISLGVEMIEFNPKADLKFGEKEYYQHWSDGSLRNIAENSPNAESAVIIHRDYTYETDLRSSGFNEENFSKSTFSLPVGAGVIMHLNDQFNFKLGASMHFTTTDYMDGYTPATSSELIGNAHANPRNDRFLLANFTISYNFQKVPAGGEIQQFYEEEERPEEYIDYAAFDDSDYDKDGIIDFLDKCPNTPEDVAVDENGCPIDTDSDGIPDFQDDEIQSPNPAYVNANGVTLSDEEIYKSYLQYIDTTGASAVVVRTNFSGESRKKINKRYKVRLGEYAEGESPADMEKMFSIPDLRVVKKGNKTIYTAGNYDQLEEATKRTHELNQQGFENASLLEKNNKGEYLPTDEILNEVPSTEAGVSEANQNRVVFRVQLGAFKNKPTPQTYANISNLFVSESGGFYRYMSGAFTDFNDAAKHKVKMIVEGYKGAFIVAYQNGERVSLKSVGVESISTSPLIGE